MFNPEHCCRRNSYCVSQDFSWKRLTWHSVSNWFNYNFYVNVSVLKVSYGNNGHAYSCVVKLKLLESCSKLLPAQCISKHQWCNENSLIQDFAATSCKIKTKFEKSLKCVSSTVFVENPQGCSLMPFRPWTSPPSHCASCTTQQLWSFSFSQSC